MTFEFSLTRFSLLFVILFLCHGGEEAQELECIDYAFTDNEYNFAGFFKSVRYGGVCKSETDCNCFENEHEIAMHCEGNLIVQVSTQKVSVETDTVIRCNKTLPSILMERDYYEGLLLSHVSSFKARFIDCPEPIDSYASLFYKKPKNLSSSDFTVPALYQMVIQCSERENFTLDRRHFKGLGHTIKIKMICHLIKELPADLLHENAKRLNTLEIHQTKIRFIPEGLFSSQILLVNLNFSDNQLTRVTKDSFLGLRSLETLDLSTNRLSFLEENVFDNVPNIKVLLLEENRFSTFANSITKLNRLIMVNLTANFISTIGRNDCSAIQNSKDLFESTTALKIERGRSCFPPILSLRAIDVSENDLLYLPDLEVNLTDLLYFRFSHNHKTIEKVRKFLVSPSLVTMEMKNSSILAVSPDFLSGFPNLTSLDLSLNKIGDLSEDFFVENEQLEVVNLHSNDLTSLPVGLFRRNRVLSKLIISRNRIKYLDALIFQGSVKLKEMDISNNDLEKISNEFSFNCLSLSYVNFSFNRITRFDNSLFSKTENLKILDISKNFLNEVQNNSFFNLTKLTHLNLSNNKLSFLDENLFVKMVDLETLDLSENFLERINMSVLLYYKNGSKLISRFHRLRNLNVDGNILTSVRIENPFNIENLHLSRNNLSEFVMIHPGKIKRLKLSNNLLRYVKLPWYQENGGMGIDLSSNSMQFCGVKVYLGPNHHDFFRIINPCTYKSLDLSNNNLNFTFARWKIDWPSRLYGKITKMRLCEYLEFLNFTNNYIEDLLFDWRTSRSLKLVDVRWNKIKVLNENDILFKTIDRYNITCEITEESQNQVCKRNLTLDLRNNEIQSVRLTSEHLVNVPEGCDRKLNYSYATILLDDNPFFCGLGVFNFLRYVEKDVALTSEVQRRTGKNLALPAQIEPGNLTCRTPELVRGKKVMETETYVHQLLPMFGICAFRGCK